MLFLPLGPTSPSTCVSVCALSSPTSLPALHPLPCCDNSASPWLSPLLSVCTPVLCWAHTETIWVPDCSRPARPAIGSLVSPMRPDYSVFGIFPSPIRPVCRDRPSEPYHSVDAGRRRADPEVKSALAAGMQRLDTIRPRPPPP